MKQHTQALLISWVLLWLGSAAEAQETARTAAQQTAVAALEATISEAMEEAPSPGLALALVSADGTLWSSGFGFANLESQRRVTADTPFFLASVSKTFIAAAMMSEVEAGRLDLEQPIHELLPFPVGNPRVRGEVIRVWHLASHTSGIRDNYHFYDAAYVDGDPTIEMDDWIESYLVAGGSRYKKRKNFRKSLPGTDHEYSNIGAALGAVVVEQTSGLAYRDLLRQRIFHPLGLENTAFDLSNFPPDTLAVPYDREAERFVPRAHYGVATYADGHLRSSANDLARYLEMMINRGSFRGEQVLAPSSVARIEQELHPDRGGNSETSQALYWSLRFDRSLLAHSGGDFGASTFIFYQPTWKTGAVILMNSQWQGSQEMTITCLQALTTAMRAFAASQEPTEAVE